MERKTTHNDIQLQNKHHLPLVSGGNTLQHTNNKYKMVQFGKTLNEVVHSEWKCHAVAYLELKRALTDDDNVVNDRSHAASGSIRIDGGSTTTTTATTTTSSNNNNNRVGCEGICGINGVNGCTDPSTATTIHVSNVNIGNNDNNNTDEASIHSHHTESSYNISEHQKQNFFIIYDDSVRRLTDFYEDRVGWARGESGEIECDVGRVSGACEGGDGGESGEVDDVYQLIGRATNVSKELGLVLEFLELNATAFSKIMKKVRVDCLLYF